MKMKIKVNDEWYTLKNKENVGETEGEMKELADEFYENVENVEKLITELEDGSYLVLAKNAVQNATFLFSEE